ncbi:MAG: radical SAM protein [Deltaproteobacteria bacterium]|uniref:radical SAM protein n=1 Tax=Desulfobacula sp. TaxID=2593537 RepID=UPI0019BD5C28|nr:radical SAM protein [Candidatus Desulfobacula maris]MBL6992407.1 radical SAM protein [Desulfobacula sp.]
MEASIITTYRCPMRCKMCDIWNNPTDPEKEITARDLEKMPMVNVTNITGGEPLIREDLAELVEVIFKKSKRVCISTSGYYSDRVLKLAEKFPDLGFRVSIEGLSQKNDDLRGREGGFDRGLRTLLGLREMGRKDVGFGITVSNSNSKDMLWLYELSKQLGMEFATAAFHNSFYFHKDDNIITNKEEVIGNFKELTERLLKENKPKSWFRAFFNLGLINYIREGKRMLPCEAGSENFFFDPYGEVLPCNGMEKKYWFESFGNIREAGSFDELWNGTQAKNIRELVAKCPKNCWMIGSASPVMKKYIKHPVKWVVANKLKSFLGQSVDLDAIPYYDVGQDPRQGDLKGVV